MKTPISIRTKGLASLAIVFCLCCRLAHAQPAAGQKYALVVGINDYGALAPKLHYAVSDATRLYETLVNPVIGGIASENAVLLTDAQADSALRPTRDNIVKALHALAKKAKPGDQFWFYFAGHGVQQNRFSFLLTPAFHWDSLQTTALSTTFVRDTLEAECKASQKVIILDACHSGSTRDAAPGLGQTFDGKGMFTLAACDINQSAWEFPDLYDGKGGGGVFTYYLVRGLRRAADSNHDGKVAVPEIRDYVSTHVASEVKQKTPGEQQPQFIDKTTHPEQIILAKVATTRDVDEPDGTGKSPDSEKLEAKEPLGPALIVVTRGEGIGVNIAETEMMKGFVQHNFPIVDPEAAHALRALTNEEAGQQAAKHGARFLVLTQVTTSSSSPVPPLITVTATLTARIVDEAGNIKGEPVVVESDPQIAGTELKAATKALIQGADRLVHDLAPRINDALGIVKKN